MKKYIYPIIIMAALVALTFTAAFGQYTLQKQVIDTTRADGQRFIITYPVRNVVFHFKDSLAGLNTSRQWMAGDEEGSTTTLTTTYISMQNSTVAFVMRVQRIVMGDTVTSHKNITVPLMDYKNRPANIFESIEMKRAAKPYYKEYVKAKLNK